MVFQVKFDINSNIYLRNPESSDLAKLMVKRAIDLIFELGFEQFTFKKLATEIGCTEATIYRYFENKHRLLLYILNWYWSYVEFLVTIRLENVTDKKERLKAIIHLLTHELPESHGQLDYNKKYLNQIAIIESSKAYLIKDVAEINKGEVYKPYKDLCAIIANIIVAYNPMYKYPRSLSTTIMETAHQQQFFCNNLQKLTDISGKKNDEFTFQFIEEMVFKILS
jgi:AraC-like DNA-binding protein